MTTPSRFLSEAECAALVKRAASFAVGGGDTSIVLNSRWSGNIRWARNRVSSIGDTRNHSLVVLRDINGAHAAVNVNQIDDRSLEAAVRRAERLRPFSHDVAESDFRDGAVDAPLRPVIWSDATYNLDAAGRAEAMQSLIVASEKAGMLTAGYIQVAGQGRAINDTKGRALYYPYTSAQYSVTVRSPDGSGSGWAGQDHYDWAKIDAVALTERALDKCLRSRNPSAVEPGRYMTILEPQAVCDLFSDLFTMTVMDRVINESPLLNDIPFQKAPLLSKLGDRMLDTRINVTSDPMDPDLGFAPFDAGGLTLGDADTYYPAQWFTGGVLTSLAYHRKYGVEVLSKSSGLPSSGAFRITGETTTMDEMVATTKRGIVVTRFSNVRAVIGPGMGRAFMLTGFTRDGTWLVENGKITRPVKNFRFAESPLLVGNQVEQLGVPVRVFHPAAPVVVPPMKVRDFNFVALADAV